MLQFTSFWIMFPTVKLPNQQTCFLCLLTNIKINLPYLELLSNSIVVAFLNQAISCGSSIDTSNWKGKKKTNSIIIRFYIFFFNVFINTCNIFRGVLLETDESHFHALRKKKEVQVLIYVIKLIKDTSRFICHTCVNLFLK